MSILSAAGVSAHLIIPGAPRTKKNHGRVIVRGGKKVHVGSAAYKLWADKTHWILRAHWQKLGLTTIDFPINCEAHFYREALVGDAVGYYQAIADALQRAGVVSDDKFIVSWDGSRLHKDAREPRIELTLRIATCSDKGANAE